MKAFTSVGVRENFQVKLEYDRTTVTNGNYVVLIFTREDGKGRYQFNIEREHAPNLVSAGKWVTGEDEAEKLKAELDDAILLVAQAANEVVDELGFGPETDDLRAAIRVWKAATEKVLKAIQQGG